MTQLVTLPEDATPAEVERAVAQHGFSRYVLVDDDGEPIGYVHLKDVLRPRGRRRATTEPVPPEAHPPAGPVLDDTDLEDALATHAPRRARTSRRCSTTTATTTGVLFLEDIIEELVGEVQDATRRRACAERSAAAGRAAQRRAARARTAAASSRCRRRARDAARSAKCGSRSHSRPP